MFVRSGAIFSSLSDGIHQVGFADNAMLRKATFGGQSVDLTSILIAYTFGGDASLDGKVDVTDLGALATNWQSTSADWIGGDFNYDGIVDVSDLAILAGNWQAGTANPGAISFDAALASLGLTVPEPVDGIWAVGALAMLKRRRTVQRRTYCRPDRIIRSQCSSVTTAKAVPYGL